MSGDRSALGPRARADALRRLREEVLDVLVVILTIRTALLLVWVTIGVESFGLLGG